MLPNNESVLIVPTSEPPVNASKPPMNWNGTATMPAMTAVSTTVSRRTRKVRQNEPVTRRHDRLMEAVTPDPLEDQSRGGEPPHRVEVDAREDARHQRDRRGDEDEQGHADQAQQARAELGPGLGEGDLPAEHRAADDDGEHAGQDHLREGGDRGPDQARPQHAAGGAEDLLGRRGVRVERGEVLGERQR